MNKPKGKPKLRQPSKRQRQLLPWRHRNVSNKNRSNSGKVERMVRNMMEEPEIQEKIGDEKSVMAKIYRDKARRIVDSINDVDIEKASLQQRAFLRRAAR